MRRVFCVLIGSTLLAGGIAAAQQQPSLAEVARREAERRKAIRTPAKVYTNDDLKTSRPITTAAAAPAPPPDAAKPAAAAAQATQAKEPARDEAFWRNRIAQAREQLQRSQMFLEALQSRANGLYAEFTARDDPAQRAVVANERAKVLAEMERVKIEIQEQTKGIADIEEEARRAGVPPGWLR